MEKLTKKPKKFETNITGVGSSASNKPIILELWLSCRDAARQVQ